MAAMAFAMGGMTNGERAVVLLFISRVLFSLLISLLSRGIALSLLALSALSLDILTDSSTSLSHYSTRPGASSGILLGAVTLPTDFISKTIQLSRVVSLHQVSIEVCCLTLGTVSLTSFESALKLLWMLCHGLAAVKLIPHVLRTFPSCSSIEPLERLSLCAYWICVIFISVLRFYNISKNSKIERILLGKYYHLMAVSMFVPALIFQPEFLDLSFGAALAVFLALEIIQVWRIWLLGQSIRKFMNAFTDNRDSDLLIVSHFSLLLGCARPIWMSSGYTDQPPDPFSGILDLGIGDTMASVVGYKYGVLRWSKTGTACSVLLPLLASTGYILTEHWCSLLLAVTISGMLEAHILQPPV